MIDFSRNDIKKKRILRIFIEAAARVIEEEGIENVTIRKVAKIAGYNSATIYNYFENCKQLIFFAAIKFIGPYVQEMPEYINRGQNNLEKFLLMWECFCKHSFRLPKIYYAIFTEDVGGRPENLVQKYYELFPEELGNPSEELIPMLKESNLAKRASYAIKPLVDEGLIAANDVEDIDEAIQLVYHGMLTMIINNRINYSAEEATEKVLKHIKRILNL